MTRPDQVWVADITHCARRKCISVLMDVYTRAVRAWNLSWSLGQELALIPLKYALNHYPAPEIHHSDQGTQSDPGKYINENMAFEGLNYDVTRLYNPDAPETV